MIISTKGILITEEPYISILRECNAVVQISMVCSSYDRMEPGAPTFEQRLGMIRALATACRRVIVRAQPYMTQVRDEFLGNIPRFAEAGAHGVTVEGMKFNKAKPGLVKVRGDFCYREDVLESHYARIRDACHANGLSFYCAENRLRPMGDSYACCGCGDLQGFEENPYNAVSIINGREVEPTEKMKQVGTARCFQSLMQYPGASKAIAGESFASMMYKGAAEYDRGQRAHTDAEKLMFTRWLSSTGMTPKEADALTGSNMGGHYLCTTPGGQCMIPTPEMFGKLRKSPRLKEIPSTIMRLVYG